MLKQSIITDDLHQEYLFVNFIQKRAAIEILIKSAINFYLDLNESRFIVRAKITKATGTDVNDNVWAALMNLLLHLLFREIRATLNDTQPSDPNPLYPYRAYLKKILNYSEET